MSIFRLSIFIFGAEVLKAQEEDEKYTLQEIEVKSFIRREELQSTGSTVLDNKDVADRNYISPLYMLRQAPGVAVREINEQGVASMVYIRGFNGGHGGEVGFYFDGIPLNDSGHADNYSDTTILIPLEIETVEILKGPVSALYGRGNAAGTAAFQGIKRGDFTRLLLRLGDYKTIDFSAIIAKDIGKLHHVYAFQGYNTDTWRENTNWKRLNLSTRWTYDVTDSLELSLNLRAAFAKWDSANQAFSWLNPKIGNDDHSGQGNMTGGHRDRLDARLFANYLINSNTQLSYYFFATTLKNNMAELYNKTPYGPNSNWVFGDDTTGNEDLVGKREAYGTGLSYNQKSLVLGNRDFSITAGVDYLWEKQKNDRYSLHWGYGNQHFEHFEDIEFKLNTLSFYAKTNLQILDKLKLRLGGRYDSMWGDFVYGFYNEEPIGPIHYKSRTLSIFSPKAGLLFTPIDNVEIFTSYGRGFNIPGLTNSRFYSLHQLKLTVRDQYELGLRSSPLEWLDFGLTLYLADTSNDVYRDLITREYVNGGATRRKGLETYAKFYPVKDLTISANYTFQDVRYRKNPQNSYLNGLRYTQIPRHLFSAEIAYEPPEGFGGRASFYWNADILLQNDPTRTPSVYKGEDFGTLDLQLSYRFLEKYKASLEVLNLLNYRPKPGVPNTDGYFAYRPANPITAFLALEMNF
ncbi:MAG: TonB-dependent receptor [Deltaproteobacteria bacterium]|jgi:outer membrane receptor protein involved in Fe transport|nr:TonB-dependent receptor [Deltaproteobacteria bacterium]